MRLRWAESGRNAIEVERLEKIRQGDRPTAAEILLIASALDIDDQVITKLVEGNGNGTTQLHS
jgi:hypothetical protein